jgi:hypothetical protein
VLSSNLILDCQERKAQKKKEKETSAPAGGGDIMSALAAKLQVHTLIVSINLSLLNVSVGVDAAKEHGWRW